MPRGRGVSSRRRPPTARPARGRRGFLKAAPERNLHVLLFMVVLQGIYPAVAFALQSLSALTTSGAFGGASSRGEGGFRKAASLQARPAPGTQGGGFLQGGESLGLMLLMFFSPSLLHFPADSGSFHVALLLLPVALLWVVCVVMAVGAALVADASGTQEVRWAPPMMLVPNLETVAPKKFGGRGTLEGPWSHGPKPCNIGILSMEPGSFFFERFIFFCSPPGVLCVSGPNHRQCFR